MKTWHGYTGTILDMDLTSGTLSETELDQLIDEYYIVRGWDESGFPEKDKLEELGIDSN